MRWKWIKGAGNPVDKVQIHFWAMRLEEGGGGGRRAPWKTDWFSETIAAVDSHSCSLSSGNEVLLASARSGRLRVLRGARSSYRRRRIDFLFQAHSRSDLRDALTVLFQASVSGPLLSSRPSSMHAYCGGDGSTAETWIQFHSVL